METKTSCIEGEPLAKLDQNGSASILNYNLPQSVSYEVTGLVQLDIDRNNFKPRELEPPKTSYWSQIEAQKKGDQLSVESITRILNGKAHSSIPELQNLALNLNSTSPATKSGLMVKSANIPVSTASVSFSTDYLANKINDGYMPVLYKRFSGKQGVKFAKQPARPDPAVYIVMRMAMASYLGDYGAGQTLSTFSLLPGEKTTISIRNFQHTEETRTSAQSILDSYSESCSDDLQTTIEEKTAQSESSTETDTDSMSAELGVSGGVNLGIVKLGGDTKGSASSVNTMTEAVGSQVDTLTSAVDHHVQTADTQRQIDINTETTATSTTETEVTTTRTLENLNRSRVLNFVFRQLLQEYYTVTYLVDVSFVYSNGYTASRKTATLSSLNSLLKRVLVAPDTVKDVTNAIYQNLCNIPDYEGNRIAFIEQVAEPLGNCIDPSQPVSKSVVVRKKKGLQQTYRDKMFNGVILDVTHRIVRTPSVIVDAVLGQGEALDCYNMELQEAAYTTANLANRKTEQALAIIDAIADPSEKVKAYRLLFGECCEKEATEEA